MLNKRKRIEKRVNEVLSAYPPDKSIISDPFGEYTGVPYEVISKENDPNAKVYYKHIKEVPTQDVDDL